MIFPVRSRDRYIRLYAIDLRILRKKQKRAVVMCMHVCVRHDRICGNFEYLFQNSAFIQKCLFSLIFVDIFFSSNSTTNNKM